MYEISIKMDKAARVKHGISIGTNISTQREGYHLNHDVRNNIINNKVLQILNKIG